MNCETCEYMKLPHDDGYCFMFKNKPESCGLNGRTVTGRKERDIRKMFDFGGIYGSRHGRMTSHKNFLIQEQAANKLMQMNFAELEMKCLAEGIKMQTIDGDCILLHDDIIQLKPKNQTPSEGNKS